MGRLTGWCFTAGAAFFLAAALADPSPLRTLTAVGLAAAAGATLARSEDRS
ncbi:hypothetical protein ACQP2F_00450 [Actinoplanes sp. CA-030573]|uniref:hypothetical protein n=1 Tax=Actinoplanes sp. CA-030573 TaxID=3239898 RepID=UPI003D8E6578